MPTTLCRSRQERIRLILCFISACNHSAVLSQADQCLQRVLGGTPLPVFWSSSTCVTNVAWA